MKLNFVAAVCIPAFFIGVGLGGVFFNGEPEGWALILGGLATFVHALFDPLFYDPEVDDAG